MANLERGKAVYGGKRILVLGAAKSGVASARLLSRLGGGVVINDMKPADPAWEGALRALGVEVVAGGHPPGLLREGGFDLIVKNPGIPYTHPYIVEAAMRRIPVITEIEVAYAVMEGEAIAITGSNGKTTTTTLTGLILARKNPETIVAGNIGEVLSEEVLKTTSTSWTVMELSSFQLKGADRFHPQVAALLNLYHHHLDYHGSMEDYISSKMNLFRNQTEEDLAIFNMDQENLLSFSERVKARRAFFSTRKRVPYGSYVGEDETGGASIFVKKGESSPPQKIMPVREVKLLGTHNLENVLAAITIAAHYEVEPAQIAETVAGFKGVEHRLEFVREVGGVRYYNDSKATNPEAAEVALRVFTKPILLIAGGLERGESFAPLISHLGKEIKRLILYGQTKERLKREAKEAGFGEVYMAEDVEEAAQMAASMAGPGEVVLLSPACASWDLYPSYEVRGSIFKETVHRL